MNSEHPSKRTSFFMMSENSLQLLNDTVDTSLYQTEMSFSLMLTFSLTSIFTCLLGLAGNGVVLRYLWFEFKRTPFTVYIHNLAVADCMLLISIIVTVLCIVVNPSSPMILMHMGYMFYIYIFSLSGYHGSLLLLMVISVERYISVLYPIWYKCQRPTHLSTIVCFLIWTFAIIIMALDKFVCNWESEDGMDPRCTLVMIFFLSWVFGIVSPILMIPNLLMVIMVKRSSKKHQPLRLYRAILLNVIVFLITTVPPKHVDAIFFFHIPVLNNFQYMSVDYVYMVLKAINSSSKPPYIYFLVGRTKKRSTKGSIKEALHRIFRSDNEMPSQDKIDCTKVYSSRDLEISA